MTTRRFYASLENFKNDVITLNIEQTRHLRNVLRLRENESVNVFDGAGREFSCAIEKIEKKETLLKIIEEISPTAPESNLNLTLAISLLKGEKFDFVVQKAVELGVSKIIPLNTKRADVKFADGGKKAERWRKIIVDATKQCGRAKLTEITEPIGFNEFVRAAFGTRILFSERNGETFSTVSDDSEMTAVVGSEGGWEDAEIEAARSCGFQIVTFNGRILRAETAAIAVAAVLQNQFGDLN